MKKDNITKAIGYSYGTTKFAKYFCDVNELLDIAVKDRGIDLWANGDFGKSAVKKLCSEIEKNWLGNKASVEKFDDTVSSFLKNLEFRDTRQKVDIVFKSNMGIESVSVYMNKARNGSFELENMSVKEGTSITLRKTTQSYWGDKLSIAFKFKMSDNENEYGVALILEPAGEIKGSSSVRTIGYCTTPDNGGWYCRDDASHYIDIGDITVGIS